MKAVIHMRLSPQQKSFLEWAVNGTGSGVLEAVAGSGKTTTILHAVEHMDGQVAICAYNKKIADEIKGKLTDKGIGWQKAQAGTVHSFGFSAYRKAFPTVKVDGKKVQLVLESLNDPVYTRFAGLLVKLVSLAKQRAIGIVTPISNDAAWYDIIDHFDILSDLEGDLGLDMKDFVSLAQNLLKLSNAKTDVVDFDDMVYLPLVYSCRFWQYDVVFIDECQDLNPARRAVVKALVKKGGRAVFVGDRNQAIYAFTGADANSIDLSAKDFNAVYMPLTVSFRCPKSVVNFARQWVDHIEASPTAIEGTVTSIPEDDLLDRPDLVAGNAILCRLTKPLISLAFRLIRKRIACNIEGRDIATGLIKLATKWTRIKTISALDDMLTNYLGKQRPKLLAANAEVQLQILEDQVESIREILDQCKLENKSSVSDVVDFINDLFRDGVENVLVLSTIHKSKGREWPTVFWYDRAHTCPSKWARKDWQKQQEMNLMYVAATRAKEHLVEVTVK